MISYPSLVKSYASYFGTPARKSYLSLGITLLTLILLILMIYPAIFYVLDVNSQLRNNREIDRLLSEKITQLNSAKQSLETLSSSLVEIDEALPNNAEVADYLKSMEAELAGTQTVISNIQMDETQLVEGDTSQTPQVIPVSYTISIGGDFNNLRNSLDRLEKLGRFTDITSAGFSARSEAGESLRLILKAKTYFYAVPELRPVTVSGASQQ
jgi:Tfp pilus assembly protein PilO